MVQQATVSGISPTYIYNSNAWTVAVLTIAMYGSLTLAECSHCEEYNLDCTFVEAAKRRGPPKGYMESLEQRCGRLERIMQQVRRLDPNFRSPVKRSWDRATSIIILPGCTC